MASAPRNFASIMNFQPPRLGNPEARLYGAHHSYAPSSPFFLVQKYTIVAKKIQDLKLFSSIVLTTNYFNRARENLTTLWAMLLWLLITNDSLNYIEI